MDNAEFRRQAHTVVDWMADYFEGIERLPVLSPVQPGEISARLPSDPPRQGEPMADILRDVERTLLPGITHWQHPNFFAYFPANNSPPSVLAEMLTATLGVQAMVWQTSPAATELETRVLDWLRQMLGLPEGFAGVIQDTASTATLCSVLVARERATGWRVNEEGLGSTGRLTVYCSTETHSSVEKAVKVAGLGRENLRKIPVDQHFAMRPDALETAIQEDRAAGHTPICVVATLGTTSASGIDPVRAIGEICRKNAIWLHVDGAWGGSALILPEYREMIDGIEYVDSLVINPHKWLMTNLDCSAHYVRDPVALVRTLEILPEYLKARERGHVVDYRDWGLALGRRFRALKLWFVIRSYGVEGLQTAVRSHIALAKSAATMLDQSGHFEILVLPTLALFCFRYRPPGITDETKLDRLNEALLDAVNSSGRAYFSHTRVNDHYAIRFSVGQRTTELRHVEAACRLIMETAQSLQAPLRG